MRLNKFLFEDWVKYPEPRSKDITLEEAADYVLKNCRDSLEGTMIRRHVHGAWKEPYRFTDPMAGQPRVSRNTANYYTLIIDNSPNWKKYPPRSRSLICGVGSRTGTHHVFLEDGARIGVCNVFDFWAAFKKQGIYDLDYNFNRVLEEIACKTVDVCKRFDDNLNSIKHTFVKIDAKKRSAPERFKALTDNIWKDVDRRWIKPYIFNTKINLYDFIENILDPKRNDFTLAKAGDRIQVNSEVWSNGKAILVRENYLTDFLNELDRRNYSIRGEYRKLQR